MKGFSIIILVIISIFVTTNFTLASTAQDLQPAQDQIFNETIQVPSLKVGSQGIGGVTFFNGTIINETTDPDTGAGMSVTFGDNVRIDGYLHGGPSLGYTDDNRALKIGDNVYPGLDNKNDFGKSTHRWRNAYFAGDVTIGNLVGTGIINSNNILDGTIVTADIADNAITSVKISNGSITGSDISNSSNLTVATATFTNGTTIGGSNASAINWYWSGLGSFEITAALGALVSANTCTIQELELDSSLPQSLNQDTDSLNAFPLNSLNSNVYFSWNTYIDSDNKVYTKLCNISGIGRSISKGTYNFRVDIWGH